jgi:hypothetical protein
LLQFGEQILGGWIRQAAGGLAHHPMDLAQPVGREQGRADGIAMAHVVVAAAEAVGGEQLLEVLAQGGRLTGEVGAGDGFELGDQVLRQGGAGFPIEGLLQQVAQQGEHPLEHRPIAQGRVATMHPTRPGACWLRGTGAAPAESVPATGLALAEAVGLQPGQIGPDRRASP